MRLVLFRSFVKGPLATTEQQQQQQQLMRIINQTIGNSSISKLDGIELSLSQIASLPIDFLQKLCSKQQQEQEEQKFRILCRMDPVNVHTVGKQLDQLSDIMSSIPSQLSSSSSSSAPPLSSSLVDLVSMHHSPHHTLTVETTTSYLYQVLPLAAQFLESYPTIGNSHGQRNAHGKPLDTHVMGISHTLIPQGRQQQQQTTTTTSPPPPPPTTTITSSSQNDLVFLSNVLDVLPPTRLSLYATQLNQLSSSLLQHDDCHNTDDRNEMFQTVLEHTDHVYFSENDNNNHDDDIVNTLLRKKKQQQEEQHDFASTCTTATITTRGIDQLWNWQQEVLQSTETYATIC